MTRPTVYQTHACPKCEREEMFATKVVLGEFSEMAKGVTTCPECGYTLTETEQQEMTQEAEYDAPELYAGEVADHRRDQRQNR